VPRPEPWPGQVLLRTRKAGVCGSDLHARVHSEQLADTVTELGYDTCMRPEQQVVLGHEILGEVVAYGPRTRKRWTQGTRIVALPVLRTDKQIHMVGFDVASPGGFAEFVVVQEAFAFPVPGGLQDDKAAFTEPLAVAMHAVRRSGIRRGRPAIVIGCGPIGLAVVLMLKAAGVRTVVASDLSPGRRDLARKCGADVVVDPRQSSPWDAYKQRGPVRSLPDYMSYGIDAMSRVRAVPGLPWQRLLRVADRAGAAPAGPVVFECVGVPGMIDQVLTAAPLRTRVVVVGVCMETDNFRPATAIHKEIDLRFVFGYDPGEFSGTLDMIAAGKVDPSPMHTGTVGLDGVAAAFDDLRDPERHAKILVDPGR
jgi:threonine dehydrogenase-like Zn-dependent dehydrogenase